MVGAITCIVLLILDFRNRTRNRTLSEPRGYGELDQGVDVRRLASSRFPFKSPVSYSSLLLLPSDSHYLMIL